MVYFPQQCLLWPDRKPVLWMKPRPMLFISVSYAWLSTLCGVKDHVIALCNISSVENGWILFYRSLSVFSTHEHGLCSQIKNVVTGFKNSPYSVVYSSFNSLLDFAQIKLPSVNEISFLLHFFIYFLFMNTHLIWWEIHGNQTTISSPQEPQTLDICATPKVDRMGVWFTELSGMMQCGT